MDFWIFKIWILTKRYTLVLRSFFVRQNFPRQPEANLAMLRYPVLRICKQEVIGR